MKRLTHTLVCATTFIAVLAFAAEKSDICLKNADKSALVIMDMQPYFATRGGNQNKPENIEKTESVLNAQIEAIKLAKENDVPIIVIEYSRWRVWGEGSTTERLKEAIGSYTNAKVIKKNRDGAFDPQNKGKKELIEHIQKLRVGTLIMTGANGGACVRFSIIGALEGNCKVVAYSQGIVDFNFEDFVYPYEGRYTAITPNCERCDLKEVSDIKEVKSVMNPPDNLGGIKESADKVEASK